MKFAMQTGLFLLVLLLIVLQPTFLLAQDAKTKAELAAAKAALQKEYETLAVLKSDLEQARQNAKTDQDIAAFKKKLAVYDRQVQSYDEKRKNYEQKLQAIADAEARKRAILETALRDQGPGPAESSAEDDHAIATGGKQEAVASKTQEQKDPAKDKEPLTESTAGQAQTGSLEAAKTGVVPVQDKDKEARAFQAEKKILEKRKEEIDKEYEALNKEKEELDSRRKERMILPEANALTEDTSALNEKIQKFDERRKEFEKDAGDFNKRVQDAGLADSEKKAPEGK